MSTVSTSRTYLQSTATECGLACVGYVAAYHGHCVSISELRAKFAVSMRGTSLGDVIRLAGLMGMQARPLKLDLQELENLTTPCILHWDLHHFVVLLSAGKQKITIHDPAEGMRTLAYSQVSSHFTGVALELMPAAEFEPAKPKPPIGWRELVGNVVGLKRSLSQLFFLAASLQIVLLIAPLFTQWIVDGVIVSGDVSLLWTVVIGFVLVVFIRTGLEWVRGWLGIVASAQFGTQWSTRVMRHLLRLPVQWFEVRHIGDIVSRFQSAQSIQQAVTGSLVEVLLDGLFAVVTLVVMAVYSLELSAIVLVAVLLYAAIRVISQPTFRRASDEVLIHEAKAQTHFIESLRATEAIKLGGLEDQRGARWLNLIVHATNRRITTQKMTMGFSAGYGLIFGLETIAILGWGAAMAIDGVLTVGMLMAFISYKDEFSSRMHRFVDNFMSIRMLGLHAERLADIVLAPQEVRSGAIIKDVVGSEVQAYAPTIRLEDVGFRYGDGCSWALRNVNLEIMSGEHIAIVGASGCGKTTLTKLILGLLSPTEGRIYVDGISMQQFGLADWRRQVGAVTQNDQLFSGTIRDNIAGFDEYIEDGKVEQSAKLAAVHDEIVAMPMGYFTLIGDMGSSLSGGQKQRILIARALYKNARMLVLDEATSHLDVVRERQVNEAIKRLEVTRITIAHRPETIAMAERVVDLSASSRLRVDAAA